MRKVAIDEVDIELSPLGVHSVRRPVSDELGTEHFAMNYFELEPGESFSGGLHTHHDQEEVFYIQSGTATFDVGLEREQVDVEAGEVIRFAPGEFQEGYNDADSETTVTGLAFGAPAAKHDWNDIESIIPCGECGEETGHGLALTDEGNFRFTCGECGTELVT